MTAAILPFPDRGPFAIRVEREDCAWLVLAREHGWLHGSRHDAMRDARELARGFGVAVAVADT
jgi:hypothetical protein